MKRSFTRHIEALLRMMKGSIMIGEALYMLCKAYFTIAGLYFIYAWYTQTLDTFAYITGIIAIIFMITNIKWYFFRK